ncbi:helix-turn-helix transcriptional regulator [Lysinibacillus sphaericus]|uniref:helix-turn-helix transcriptional regulator n=1 Tax=Lysinibacillus sphaericus TaxID=1421 RepID=UPI0019102223|nr:helix-turn-helix transcriptional regulator [Lysinibacillus sphaericus]QPA56270.1 helix-turn-helix transcriptional regulator [Lysinibacillus sphaericus]
MRKFLVDLRKKVNLTQFELSEKLVISEIYVRKLEQGSRNPSVNTMLKYEKFFGESMKDMFPDIFFDNNDTKCIKNIS